MNDIIVKMRNELRMVLKDSVDDYPKKPREQWLFDWPSQVILVVNQIFWCLEVEQAFVDMSKGKKDAMAVYNDFQVGSCQTLKAHRKQHRGRLGPGFTPATALT